MALHLIISFSQSNAYDKSKTKIGKGICFGLCIWLVETIRTLGNNDFLQYIQSFALKPGKLMETSLKYQKESNHGRLDAIAGLIFDIDLAHDTVKIGETMTIAYALLDSAGANDAAFILTIRGKKWGHATVLFQKGGQCYWFDPNFGLYTINSIDTVGDLMKFLLENYPDISEARLNHLAMH